MKCEYCEKHLNKSSVMIKKDEGDRWTEFICYTCGSKKSILKAKNKEEE